MGRVMAFHRMDRRVRPKIAIIGGGLTGLTAAYLLKKQGISATVIEARDRLGGRIHTKYLDGGAIEMGATWLGKKHIHLRKLLEELQWGIFEQWVGEYAFFEPNSMTPPQLVKLPDNQEPTYRIKGGSSQLIRQLAAHLEPSHIQLNQAVHAIRFLEEYVQIETSEREFRADLVITTLPPSLLVRTIGFTPALPESLVTLAAKTHTWMGTSIKAGLIYSQPFWRMPRSSGSLFSNVGPLTEMYDHSTFDQTGFALKGFVNPGLHGASKAERSQLVVQQLRKFYGENADDYSTYEECVWSQEPYTFIPYNEYVLPHQHNGDLVFRTPYQNGRLLIAGAETAEDFPGYMDGAVQSAGWAVRQIIRQGVDTIPPSPEHSAS